MTTAYLALKIFNPEIETEVVPFDKIIPAVLSGELHHLWIYLVAPFVGAALATLTMRVLHSHKHKSESEAAQGR